MSSLIRCKAHRLQGSSAADARRASRFFDARLCLAGAAGRPGSPQQQRSMLQRSMFEVSRDQNGISSSMSLLRAPAATARRGAALDGPPDPKSPPDESSDPKLPPPPPLRPSSMVSVELKFCSTTSVEYFSTPLWSVHLRVCNWPSI